MGYLDSLKVVTATKSSHLPPIIHRRNNLLNKLDEQIQCARHKAEGRDYYVERTKTVANDSGERTRVVHQKRINQWWYRGADGKLVLEVRYANKRLEIQKGKTGIEVENIDSLIPALELIKKAVESGELDNSINATAQSIRGKIAK